MFVKCQKVEKNTNYSFPFIAQGDIPKDKMSQTRQQNVKSIIYDECINQILTFKKLETRKSFLICLKDIDWLIVFNMKKKEGQKEKKEGKKERNSWINHFNEVSLSLVDDH